MQFSAILAIVSLAVLSSGMNARACVDRRGVEAESCEMSFRRNIVTAEAAEPTPYPDDIVRACVDRRGGVDTQGCEMVFRRNIATARWKY
ncbi:hypothetical protein B0H14DRAFT_3487610 [Mycena olivaceomarginata]|nr:hypothetical protein B0H14DRAFT_3487610 [Mycena olivaceomarginata]